MLHTGIDTASRQIKDGTEEWQEAVALRDELAGDGDTRARRAWGEYFLLRRSVKIGTIAKT
jgi:hypothetical protein